MKALLGSGSTPLSSRSFFAVALLLLTGCALTRPPEEEAPSNVETVDIGYGSVEKGDAVGSVATELTEDQPSVNAQTLANMLAKIPGVQVIDRPGGEFSVRIRGTNSFMAGEEPLYVIDGMVVATGGGLSGINPSTVESITVLKDAGSTAIYGARGANGVILIKTKKR
jgi:TonB-dependent SusC/RagA subfamily outer membrane receptor